MNYLVGAAVVITALCQPAIAAPNKTVDNALFLCALFDQTGLTSAPCAVSGLDGQVRVSLDMSAGEARDLCGNMVAFMQQKARFFDERWTLQIRSPYSGDNSIAWCKLPN